MMKHNGIQRLVWQGNCVQGATYSGQFIIQKLSIIQRDQSIANHAPAHGISQQSMAACPEQRITMKPSSLLFQKRALFSEQLQALFGLKPG